MSLGCYAGRVLSPLRSICGNMTSSTKPEVDNGGGPSHGHMQYAQKFGEVRSCDFEVMSTRTDRQTAKQSYRHPSVKFEINDHEPLEHKVKPVAHEEAFTSTQMSCCKHERHSWITKS